MAIIDVKENWKGWQSSVDTESGGVVRLFDVLFDEYDNPESRVLIARDHPSIPAIYDSHPYDGWLYVVNKTVRPKGGPLLFEVIVNYSSIEDPLAAEPEIEYYFATSNEPVDVDRDNNPLVNSSAESYDPPITKDFHDLVIRIKRNEPAFDYAFAHTMKGSVNADLFFGFDPGTVKCTVFDGQQTRASSLTYWQVVYEFQVRADGWKRKIIDEGFRKKTGVDADNKPTYELFVDDKGKSLSQPVLLDGSGDKLADGEGVVKLEFDLDKEEIFATFNFA